MHDTEDKAWWCEKGADDEKRFVSDVAPLYGLYAEINPQKEFLKDGKYLPDLFVNGVMSDLKHVTTPFYTARRYGLDPATTLTINKKDIDRYCANYPYIKIYFWVRWLAGENFGVSVPEVNGVWSTTIPRLLHYVVNNEVPIHHYKKRTDDISGNAKSSYLISFDKLKCIGISEVVK